MIVAERQRQRRLAEKRLQKSIARLLKALEKELASPSPLRTIRCRGTLRFVRRRGFRLASLDTDIAATVRGSPAWREKEDLLASVPGVGPVIARTLIAELPELGTLGRNPSMSSGDRGARRPRPLDAAIRRMARQEPHRRRQI